MNIAPKLIQAIEVCFTRGSGTETDPNRLVTAYYSPDGNFLAARDPLPYNDSKDQK